MAVVIFGTLLDIASGLNHANVRIPTGFNRLLRWLFVTPGMARAHHSVEDDETNSNFDFDLPWQDRPFGACRLSRSA